MVHWFDALLGDVRGSLGTKQHLVVNGGLSVSGLQHVGRLRGEIVLSHCLSRALRDEGRTVTQGPGQDTKNQCKRVGNARAIRINGTETADYECECGDKGTSKLELGKLNWRLEWPAIWKVLAVDVEPFGKDHAAPGGSRDSCKDIAQSVMQFTPPFGIPYEWVGYGDKGVDKGDMGSSDAIGFGPATWAAVGDPEVLRYRYLTVPASHVSCWTFPEL